jgi:hypothetical protein
VISQNWGFNKKLAKFVEFTLGKHNYPSFLSKKEKKWSEKISVPESSNYVPSNWIEC